MEGNECSISFSAGCGWPGNQYGATPRGKHFDIKIFGSKGVLMFGGDDKDRDSGQLEVRYFDDKKERAVGSPSICSAMPLKSTTIFFDMSPRPYVSSSENFHSCPSSWLTSIMSTSAIQYG